MTEYVAGFMFDRTKKRVLVIRKNRPTWQRDKFNGVGGHIEEGETPMEAMIREFEEETGIQHTAWTPFADLCSKYAYSEEDVRREGSEMAWKVYFFKAVGDIDKAKQATDELVCSIYTNPLSQFCMRNLHWLIPLALCEDVYISAEEEKEK